MERIKGSSFHYSTYQSPAQQHGTAEASAEKKNTQETETSGNYDVLDFSGVRRSQMEGSLEQMDPLRKNSPTDEWKRQFSYKYNDNGSATAYTRMASASTKSQVRGAMGEAHRNMASLRLVVAFGDDKDKAKAKAAISSLQKLLTRGKRKMRRLDEETLVKIKKDRAEKKNELKRARQMKLELEKKRTRRQLADSMLRTEGMLDDANRKLQFQEDGEQKYGAAVPNTTTPNAAVSNAAVPGVAMTDVPVLSGEPSSVE